MSNLTVQLFGLSTLPATSTDQYSTVTTLSLWRLNGAVTVTASPACAGRPLTLEYVAATPLPPAWSVAESAIVRERPATQTSGASSVVVGAVPSGVADAASERRPRFVAASRARTS